MVWRKAPSSRNKRSKPDEEEESPLEDPEEDRVDYYENDNYSEDEFPSPEDLITLSASVMSAIECYGKLFINMKESER